jgi:hypothetical protein
MRKRLVAIRWSVYNTRLCRKAACVQLGFGFKMPSLSVKIFRAIFLALDLDCDSYPKPALWCATTQMFLDIGPLRTSSPTLVSVEETTADIQELLFHLYFSASDAQTVNKSNVGALVRLAHKYDMPQCMLRYDEFMTATVPLSTANAGQWMSFATKYSLPGATLEKFLGR